MIVKKQHILIQAFVSVEGLLPVNISKADEFDAPQPKWKQIAEGPASTVEEPNMSDAKEQCKSEVVRKSFTRPYLPRVSSRSLPN